MAYRLALSLDMDMVHPIFHVSMLRKYLHDPSHVLHRQEVQLDSLLAYDEVLVAIIDRQVKKLRSKEIPSVKGFFFFGETTLKRRQLGSLKRI